MRIPILMAVILFILSVCVDIYIFLDLKRNFRQNRILSTLYGISSFILWAALAIAILMPRRDADTDIVPLMWCFYSYLTIYLPKLIFTFFSLAGGIPHIWKGKSLYLGKWVGLPLAIITFFALWWGARVTRNNIEIVEIDITSPKIPAAFDGYRIVQISDLHTGTRGNDTRFIARICDTINALQPDLILFTGDIVNRQTRELRPFLKTLSALHAKDGVYSVLGNHDYGDYMDWKSPQDKKDNLQLLKNWQKQIGWHLLNNERTDIVAGNDTIQLIGVENWGEPPFHQYGHLIDAYPLESDSVYNLNDHRYKILMTHNPEHWLREVTKVSNIDLTLSGHTHAMQTEFRIGNLRWSPSAFRYSTWAGLYQQSSKDGSPMMLYVNIGAGEVGMPFRIGATPEITLITLRNSDKN
ncbi:MAG: metallophosphoesterase [Muribaculaceae bacterium]|nr:metallophosphoesterase [Muribaculaceae bacterium]